MVCWSCLTFKYIHHVLFGVLSANLRKYEQSEDSILRHRMKEFEDNDNMVMRRVVKEIKGHRVVVMEVGPSDLDHLSGNEVADDETSIEGSILEECPDSR